MNEQKNNNGRGIFYGVIGVATLVVAIIGATFAYFTASASNNTLTGNMATITFGLSVEKMTTVDEEDGGLIPMSNNMVEAAVSASEPCEDDNGNAVCQIWKITVDNTGTAGLFLDGYVSLTGGSGTPADYTTYSNASAVTTMRWAQVFVNGTTYTTAGTSTAGATGANGSSGSIVGIDSAWGSLDAKSDDTGLNTSNILSAMSDVTSTGWISGNTYDIISRNYIRVSDHDETATTYDRTTDITSALVFNQQLLTGGTQEYYIVVWLTENGTDQTVGSATSTDTNLATTNIDFYSGNVTFVSAQGSEVTATFSGYTHVPSDTTTSG